MLGREEAKRGSFMGEFLEPVQFSHGRSGEVFGKPILVAERSQVKRPRSEAPEAFFIQVVIVAVGNEDDLKIGQLTRRKRKGDVAGEEGPGSSENGVCEDILTLKTYPECGMSQVGNGISLPQNLSYRGTNHGELGRMALGRGVRVGPQNPLEQLPKRCHLISPGPGVDEAGILVMGLRPGKVLEVRLIERSCRRRLQEQ
jgi:hypothetical protein